MCNILSCPEDNIALKVPKITMVNYYGKLLWIITMDNCGADLEEIAESTDTDGPTSLGAHR